MLTIKQQKWIASLSDEDTIEIFPFDKSSQQKFEKIKKTIKAGLGDKTRVEHRGSTRLGIAGQNEIDVYVPVPSNIFYKKTLVPELIKIYGSPKSVHQTRIRFQVIEGGKKIDIFLIDEESDEWLNGIEFENYLETHKEALKEYEELKYNCNGFSKRKYYEKKVDFINNILSR